MLNEVAGLVLEAGELLRKYYKQENLKIDSKPDGSPVTEADCAVSDFFIKSLKKYHYQVVTEEQVSIVSPDADYFLIDPIDGTRYFINGQDHYAILLAFISKGRPQMGITYFPSMNLFYSAEKGKGAVLNGEPIYHSQIRKDIIAFSVGFHKRPEAEEIFKKLNIKHVLEQESVLKMTRIAEGSADLFPRFGRTYEWDTASTQILLEEAGCSVFDVNTLEPLKYSKKDFKNKGFIVFRNDLLNLVLEVLEEFRSKK